MAYTVKDFSNFQKFDYKGYTVQLFCIDESFWSGKRTYQANVCISDVTYYRVVEEIRNMRMQQQNSMQQQDSMSSFMRSFIPIQNSSTITLNRQTIDRIKSIVPFYESFTINVNRKHTILVENRPYVLDAISQIESIINTQYGEAINRFSINTINSLI